MNETLLREYIRGQLLTEFLGAFIIGGAAAGATVSWLMSDDQEDVADALEEIQDVAEDLQDAVQNMIENIEHEAISAVIIEQGTGAVEIIKASMEEAKATISDAVKGAIEGDEELLKEVPMGEAGKMAEIAILAAVANVVKSLTVAEEE